MILYTYALSLSLQVCKSSRPLPVQWKLFNSVGCAYTQTHNPSPSRVFHEFIKYARTKVSLVVPLYRLYAIDCTLIYNIHIGITLGLLNASFPATVDPIEHYYLRSIYYNISSVDVSWIIYIYIYSFLIFIVIVLRVYNVILSFALMHFVYFTKYHFWIMRFIEYAFCFIVIIKKSII